MGTFSKSLASLGGYAVANETVIDYIRHNSRPFIFSASIPPANAAVALAALRYIRSHPGIVDRLSELSSYMRRGVEAPRRARSSNRTRPIIPIYTYTAENTLVKARSIYEKGVYVNTVLPPATAADKCLLRTSYMATLTEELLDEAIEVFASELAEVEA